MVRHGNGPPSPGCIDMHEALLLQHAIRGGAHGPGSGLPSRQQNVTPSPAPQTVVPRHGHLTHGVIPAHSHLPDGGIQPHFQAPRPLPAVPLNDIMQLREIIPGRAMLGITPISTPGNPRQFNRARFRGRNRSHNGAPGRLRAPTFNRRPVDAHTHGDRGSSIRGGSFSRHIDRGGVQIDPGSNIRNNWPRTGSRSGMAIRNPSFNGPVRANPQPWPNSVSMSDTRVQTDIPGHPGGGAVNSGSLDPLSGMNQDIAKQFLDFVADMNGSQSGLLGDSMPSTTGPDFWDQPPTDTVDVTGPTGWNLQQTTTTSPFSQDSQSSETWQEASTIISDETGIYYFYYQSQNSEGIRVNVTKEGFCRRYAQTTESKMCVRMCYSDRQCPRSLKCCPNGCSLSCIRPFIPDINPPDPGHVVDAPTDNSRNIGTDCTPCQTNADCGEQGFCYFKPSCARKTCQMDLL